MKPHAVAVVHRCPGVVDAGVGARREPDRAGLPDGDSEWHVGTPGPEVDVELARLLAGIRLLPAQSDGEGDRALLERVVALDNAPLVRPTLIRAAWPKDPPLHPLSTWHYWSKVQEKFLTARLFPWTDDLCRDSEAAFKHPELFRAWRAQAMLEAPEPVKVWLTRKGDEVQARLIGAAAPLAIGDLETFLGQKVAYALAVGRGKIRNLSTDVRLGLIALAQNRQLRKHELRPYSSTSYPGPVLRLVPRRGLDGAQYESTWLLRGWPD